MKEKAVELLLSKQKAMFQRALYLCKNTTDAEDLLNDTNVKLLSMIDRGTCPDEISFTEYFTQAVSSVFIDRVRKRKISTAELKSDNYLQIEDSPNKGVHFSDIMEKAKVPLHTQSIFEIFLTGENMYEFSKKNNINTNTIRSNIHRAKFYLNRNKHLFEDLKEGFDLITNEKCLPAKKKNRSLTAR